MNRWEQEAERLYDEWRSGTQVGERFTRIVAAALEAEAERVTERDISISRGMLHPLAIRDAIRQAQDKESEG